MASHRCDRQSDSCHRSHRRSGSVNGVTGAIAPTGDSVSKAGATSRTQLKLQRATPENLRPGCINCARISYLQIGIPRTSTFHVKDVYKACAGERVEARTDNATVKLARACTCQETAATWKTNGNLHNIRFPPKCSQRFRTERISFGK